MDYESWNVDLGGSTAFHQTGFQVTVEGDPTDPYAVTPDVFPEGLNALEQARLLRCGVQAIMNKAREISKSLEPSED